MFYVPLLLRYVGIGLASTSRNRRRYSEKSKLKQPTKLVGRNWITVKKIWDWVSWNWLRQFLFFGISVAFHLNSLLQLSLLQRKKLGFLVVYGFFIMHTIHRLICIPVSFVYFLFRCCLLLTIIPFLEKCFYATAGAI